MKLTLLILTMGAAMAAQATNWYVDGANGSDVAAGTSEATAVRTLRRVNALDVKPGDRVLFKRGGLWRGTLRPRSGAEGNPVVYSSYGEGPKPVIQNSVDRSSPDDWVSAGDGVWATKPVSTPPLLEPRWQDAGELRGWSLHVENGNAGKLSVERDADGSRFVRVAMTKKASGLANHVQVWGPQVRNLPDAALMRLKVRATKPFRLTTFEIMRGAPPWTTALRGSASAVEIGPEWQTLDVTLASQGAADPAAFHFNLGDSIPDGATFDFVPVGLWRVDPDKCAALSADVGIFIVNHGEKWGWKKWTNPDWKTPHQGRNKWTDTVKLVNDLDYTYDANARRVFVKYPKNPGEAFDSIELALTKTIVNEGGCHDVVYDGLCVRYGGAHGFGGGSTRNIVIRNCDICWIGGGLQFWEKDKKTGETLSPVRFGNGIEFWGACANNLVERNRLWQIYDAALTNQTAGDPRPEVDVTWRDNVIWQAEYSFEYWNHDPKGLTANVLFEHNTCVDAGFCWSHAQRPDPNGAHLMFYDNSAPTTNVVVRNNLFVRTTDRSTRLCNDWRMRDFATREGLEMANNLYWIPENLVCRFQPNGRDIKSSDPRVRRKAGDWGAGADEFERYRRELGLDQGSVYGEPQFVDEAKRDYRLKPGTLGAGLATDGGTLGARGVPGLDEDQSAGEHRATDFRAGEWNVSFVPAEQTLTLRHAASGAEVAGRFSFTGPDRATDAAAAPTRDWRVASSRDGAPHRLAIVDRNNDAQGYVTFQPNGERLSLLVYHRTALAYRGAFTFAGRITARPDAFAATTQPKVGARVLQLASGDPESRFNDTLFSAANDEALQIRASNLRLVAKGRGVYDFSLSGRITEAAEAAVSFNVERDYYRSRWVPYYKPIDRARCPKAPTGWLSWNTYFDKAGSKENLAEARLGAKYLKPFGLEFWSIESWQENSSELPVSKFYNMNLETHPEQFPEGMKWLADEIRKLGFRPGIWTAPFGTGNTNFYKAHTDWFLHDRNGKPISCWNGKFTLDPTVPAAREHLKNIHRIASRDWGYEFFKIDGMSGRGASYCAHLYERPDIRARFKDPTCPNPFELCVKAYREGIGEDRVFLACQGHFTGAEAAYADASRTGADIVHPNEPVKWENILLQARCTINQVFAHNVVFWADPDCMLVSQQALAREQAQVEATVVALPGQQTFAGDHLGELAPDRIRLLQQALPVCDVRPAALYPMFGHLPVWNLHVQRPFGDWHVVALFNWGDEAAKVGFDWGEVGEPADRAFACWEFWTGTWQGVKAGRFEMEVPARGVRLVAMQPAAAHPQFLTSDRHLTQGGVELKGTSWSGGRLSATLEVVGGFPMTARFTVPKGFAFKGVEVPAGVKAETKLEAGGAVLAVTLATEKTAEVPLALTFSR